MIADRGEIDDDAGADTWGDPAEHGPQPGSVDRSESERNSFRIFWTRAVLWLCSSALELYGVPLHGTA